MSESIEPNNERPVLLTHAANGVSRITFNRPAKRNAMNRATRAAFVLALDECRGQSKVIVLAGNGPAFCAGMDLKEDPGTSTGDPLLDRRSEWAEIQEELRRHPAIIIAAVHGFALGGGSTLIHVADLAIAADDAQIGMPELGFGLYPTLAAPASQMRIGKKRAAWMVLTTERINGTTAAEWGMVNKSVPAEQVLAEAEALAERVAAFDATSLEWSKRALWKIPDELHEWTSAIEYGDHVAKQIASRTTTIADGLANFASGQRGQGQG